MPRSLPMVTRFSVAVMRSSTVAVWDATPICSRTSSGWAATSIPATVAEPSVGRLNVVRMRIAVVLPAPLWPRRPRMVPGSTCRSRSRRAQRSPNRLPRPFVVTPPLAGAGETTSGRGVVVSYMVRDLSSTLYDMARSSSSRSGRTRDPDERIAEKVDRKTAAAGAKTRAKFAAADTKTQAKFAKAGAKTQAKLAAAEAKIDAKTAAARAKLAQADAHVQAGGASAAAALGRVAAQLDALDLWTRTEPGARKPRLGRAELASVAIRVADTEGIDAVSMRRIAIELEVGTMTLYHYVRTKDELLALMFDELLREVVVPDGELPRDWREAMTVIAHRSRDSLRRHPWVFDVSGAPTIGPNAMRHFDQSWQAVAGLDADLDTKLDVITAVDEYTFGSCLWDRQHYDDGDDDHPGMVGYMEELLAEGDYPALEALTAEMGMPELWARMQAHAAAEDRFDRNLARLLSGFADGTGR